MVLKKAQQPRPAAKAPDPVAEHLKQKYAAVETRTAELVKSGNVGQANQPAPGGLLVDVVLIPKSPAPAPTGDQSAVPAAGDTLVEPVQLPDSVDAPTEVSEQAASAFNAETEAAMARIGTRLQAVHEAEVVNYHVAGAELIALVGPPTDRLPFGQKVMEVLSERYETSLTTLYAARQFAHKFPDLAEFQRQHPEATGFSRVKQLLSEKKSGGQPGRQSDRRLADKFFRDLEQMCEQVPELGEHMNKRQIRQLHALVEQLTEVVGTHLPLPVTPHSNTAEAAVKPEDDSAEVVQPD
jgi:hypothetical protein